MEENRNKEGNKRKGKERKGRIGKERKGKERKGKEIRICLPKFFKFSFLIYTPHPLCEMTHYQDLQVAVIYILHHL
jgi:hypothetical protein